MLDSKKLSRRTLSRRVRGGECSSSVSSDRKGTSSCETEQGVTGLPGT